MSKAIPISAFNSVPVVIFKNKSMGDKIVVWVCATPEVARRAAQSLRSMEHIELIEASDAHVEGAELL